MGGKGAAGGGAGVAVDSLVSFFSDVAGAATGAVVGAAASVIVAGAAVVAGAAGVVAVVAGAASGAAAGAVASLFFLPRILAKISFIPEEGALADAVGKRVPTALSDMLLRDSPIERTAHCP